MNEYRKDICVSIISKLDDLLIKELFNEQPITASEEDITSLELIIHYATSANLYTVDEDSYENKEDYIRSKMALSVLKLINEYFDYLDEYSEVFNEQSESQE